MAQGTADVGASGRRYDIDRLRVIALGFLIVFHVLSFFAVDGWVVNYPHPSIWADHLMALMAPWRMPLVFLVGGVALRLLMEKVGPGGLVRDRVQRLLPPFLLAVLILVPPAQYLSELEHHSFQGSFWQFLAGPAWVSMHYHGVPLPAQQHAWFLPYLLAYACIAALIAKYARASLARAQSFTERRLVGWPLIALVVLSFLLVDGVVNPFHQRAPLIFTDITGHLRFAPVFALGFVMARSAPMWCWLKARWRALTAIAAALLVALVALRLSSNVFALGEPAMPLGALSGAFGAASLMAIIAWGVAKLNRPAPWLAYANDAILPVYILHMPFIVLVAHQLRAWHWSTAEALPTLLVVASVGPLVIYEICIRRVPVMRFLFGLKREARAPAQKPLSEAKRSRWKAAPP